METTVSEKNELSNVCKDNPGTKQCEEYGLQFFCNSNDMARTNCKKSCGKCQRCTDRDKSVCEEHKRDICTAQQNKNWTNTYCARFCGLCDFSTSSEPPSSDLPTGNTIAVVVCGVLGSILLVGCIFMVCRKAQKRKKIVSVHYSNMDESVTGVPVACVGDSQYDEIADDVFSDKSHITVNFPSINLDNEVKSSINGDTNERLDSSYRNQQLAIVQGNGTVGTEREGNRHTHMQQENVGISMNGHTNGETCYSYGETKINNDTEDPYNHLQRDYLPPKNAKMNSYDHINRNLIEKNDADYNSFTQVDNSFDDMYDSKIQTDKSDPNYFMLEVPVNNTGGESRREET